MVNLDHRFSFKIIIETKGNKKSCFYDVCSSELLDLEKISIVYFS